MTDLELHDWALARYGSKDLANKGAIVQQLHRDAQSDDPCTLLYLPDFDTYPADHATITCALRANLEVPVVGSIGRDCDGCGDPIWVGPAIQAIAAEIPLPVEYLCVACSLLVEAEL